MKKTKPKFWSQKKSLFSILLYPISLIVQIYIFLKRRFSSKNKFRIPVICVGNIYIGGTGKTPLSILISRELLNLGKRPAIIRKYYKKHKDEHEMIKENFKNLILNEDRTQGVKAAQEQGYDTVILDDGFQDYKIEKNLSILCFNSKQLLGNELVLPAGPLRENLSSVKNAQIVMINGKNNLSFEKKLSNLNQNIKIFYSKYKVIDLDKFKNKKLFAIAGIGNPDNFFDLLVENSLQIEKRLAYPDHYEFSKEEFEKLVDEANEKNYQIIMTEKDYYKIKDFNFKEVQYLKVNLEIKNKDQFLREINNLYD
tara:strand:- start:349 stop:1281 length:933 start_codon:yes stop_codon:yes gene_type:complete